MGSRTIAPCWSASRTRSGASCCLICSAFLRPSVADGVGGAIGSMVIYLLMAAALFYRPRGLFGAQG
jgi:hypothetical protein